jgi:DNA polymerase III alpha subunit
MKLKAHNSYCERKRGNEKYEIHPILEDILGYTYGILIYQEQCMRVLNVVGRIPLKDCEAVRKAISKKQIEKFRKYREAFIKNGQEVLERPAEYLEYLWSLIEAFAGYGFNQSHATAYCYNSARMLYLKAHKPKGFFTAFINNINCTGPDDYRKMKEYIQETEKNGIEVKRVDYNYSRAEMKFENDCCYYPFSKIKGIGTDTAKRIESLQPYTGFEDFLTRFGTDAKVVSALIALRAIPGEPLVLWEFYEKFKEYTKKQTEIDKRFQTAHGKFNSEVLRLTGRDLNLKLCQEDLAKLYVEFPEGHCHYKKSRALYKRFIRVLNNYNKNKLAIRPSLDNFEPTGEVEDIEYSELLSRSAQDADVQFIGFPWNHPIEAAIKAINKTEKIITFEDFDLSGSGVSEVDIVINKVEERTSTKKPTSNRPPTKFYSLEVEDATSRKKWITVWEKDYQQFEDDLKQGNIVRISIKAPVPPFSSLTIAPSTSRWKLPPRDKDYRVLLVKRAES